MEANDGMGMAASIKNTAAAQVRMRQMAPRLYALAAVAQMAAVDSGLLERLLAFPAGVEWIAREVMALLAAVPGSPSRMVWAWAEDAGAASLASLAGVVRACDNARRALMEVSRARVAWVVRSTWLSRLLKWNGCWGHAWARQAVARFDSLDGCSSSSTLC